MSFRSEVSGHDTVHFDKTLRMLRRLEALHPALPLPRRLMRVLCSIVEVPALPMSHSRQNDFLRGAVATELIRNDYARSTPTAPQQPPKESRGSKTISLWLHQNIDYSSVLIHGAPKIMLHSIDLQKPLRRGTIYRPTSAVSASAWPRIPLRTCRTSGGSFRSSTGFLGRPSSTPLRAD